MSSYRFSTKENASNARCGPSGGQWGWLSFKPSTLKSLLLQGWRGPWPTLTVYLARGFQVRTLGLPAEICVLSLLWHSRLAHLLFIEGINPFCGFALEAGAKVIEGWASGGLLNSLGPTVLS